MRMSKFIPIIIPPLQDELLISWLLRLSEANGLPIFSFCQKYFNKKSRKGYVLPDVRINFPLFFNSLNCNVDMMDFYFSLSTAKFEMSFLPTKMQLKNIHNITRPESQLNLIGRYFIHDIKYCPQCVKEDSEQYGQPYLHRAHHLSGVVACHKHHTALHHVTINKSINEYIFDGPAVVDNISEYDCKYADYTYQLHVQGMSTHVENIIPIIVNKVKKVQNNPNLTRIEVSKILADICESQYDKKWTANHLGIPVDETIKILMTLFPNVNDFLQELPPFQMIIKKYCEQCNQYYYTTEYAIQTGWGCVNCDSKLSEHELLQRLIDVGGKSEYQIIGSFKSTSDKILLHHNVCDHDFNVVVTDFLFKYKRCSCMHKLPTHEIESFMQLHPEFELIEFKGTAYPVTLYHKVCQNKFQLTRYKMFVETPKCRCCEVKHHVNQEIFNKEVRDLVGDEYTVLSSVKNRNAHVDMLHNTCGHVSNIRISEFLQGTRCSYCGLKVYRKTLIQLLQQYAGDRYQFLKSESVYWYLYDNVEKKEIKIMSKHILQEILRPTPSEILCGDHGNVNVELLVWPIESFEKGCQLYIEYQQEFNTTKISPKTIYKQRMLGSWCRSQRVAYRKNNLSDEQIQRLISIGFQFN